MSLVTTAPRSLRIALGTGAPGSFDAGLPVLAGESVENLFAPARAAGQAGAFALFAEGDWLLGAATVPVTPTANVETAAHQLYGDIVHAIPGRHLARIWNYIPAINEPGPAGLENYRLFCRGRSLAFEQHHGQHFRTLLPAASAVGSKAAALTVIFAANVATPRHVENPLQVPAYDYPSDYGPRAPSFARATLIHRRDQATAFISGTAAIRGHTSIAPHSLPDQLACTVENLREISHTCGLGPDLDLGVGTVRHFKIYVRHATDQPAIAAMLEQTLLRRTDRVSYVLADICRAELLVEIEASLFQASPHPQTI